jgi:hypothetical protein
MNEARLFQASPTYKRVMEALRGRAVSAVLACSSNEPERLAGRKRYLEMIEEFEAAVGDLANERVIT